jgi:hypothetical protein
VRRVDLIAASSYGEVAAGREAEKSHGARALARPLRLRLVEAPTRLCSYSLDQVTESRQVFVLSVDMAQRVGDNLGSTARKRPMSQY